VPGDSDHPAAPRPYANDAAAANSCEPDSSALADVPHHASPLLHAYVAHIASSLPYAYVTHCAPAQLSAYADASSAYWITYFWISFSSTTVAAFQLKAKWSEGQIKIQQTS